MLKYKLERRSVWEELIFWKIIKTFLLPGLSSGFKPGLCLNRAKGYLCAHYGKRYKQVPGNYFSL